MDSLLDHLATVHAASPLPFPLDERRCLCLELERPQALPAGTDPADPASLSAWIEGQVRAARADFAAGGYAENRSLYEMSEVFRGPEGNRTLHLGIDLWMEAGTPVHATLDGRVHSTRDNAGFGDYGPTIILEHPAPGMGPEACFYALYGHLSRASLALTRPGRLVSAGQPIGWLGAPEENGGWPAHLHFQLIRDLEGRVGDHPGVCRPSERAFWLSRCPDPNLLLRIPALRRP